MSGLVTRTLTFGGATIELAYTAGRPKEIVEFLFKRVPSGPPTASDQPGLILSEDPANGVLTLSRRGVVCCVDRSAAAIASWLLHVACSELAAGGASGLLLHAAAVGWRGRSLVLPGATGSGKSTLAAYLAGKGFDYMTDELAHVSSASTRVEGFAVPLKIKKAGLNAIKRYVSPPSDVTASMAGPFDILMVPDTSERATSDAALSVIVFPRYQQRSRFSLKALSPSQTGLRLMTSVLNGGGLPDHGFREAARIAGFAAGYEMRFANLAQIGAHIETLRLLVSGSDTKSSRDRLLPTTTARLTPITDPSPRPRQKTS